MINAIFWLVGGVALTMLTQRAFRYGILGMWIPKSRRKTKYAGYEDYGHPYPPVPYLADQLPKPPNNTAWEIVTTTGDTIWLELRLINLLEANKILNFRRTDLIKNSTYNQTWLTRYRKNADVYDLDANCTFREDLIDPLLKWAERQVDLRPNIPTVVDEYMMKS